MKKIKTPESKYNKIENAQKRKNNCESVQIVQILHILYVRGGAAPSDSAGLPLHSHESESDL